jgi:hypothetical protein
LAAPASEVPPRCSLNLHMNYEGSSQVVPLTEAGCPETNRKKLTIFFSDLVNFTATTDKLESEDLTNLLNRYLTEMSNIALESAPPSTNISATPSWCSSAIQNRRA